MYKLVYDIFNPDGKFVATTFSLRDAAKIIGCSHEGVRKAVNAERPIKKWYVAPRELTGNEILIVQEYEI